jgi:hypothetical protein
MDDQELRIISSDTLSELVLRFTPEMEFGYGDSRHAPESEKHPRNRVHENFRPQDAERL